MRAKVKKKNIRMLAAVAVGVVFNVVVLAILGGVTIFRFITPKAVELRAPDALVALEPSFVKYSQLKTKDLQEISRKPRQNQIRVRDIAQISAPDIEIEIANMGPAVAVGTSTLDSPGLGMGLSTSSLRMGVSAVDFFGIQSRGERIAIILDIAESMLDPKRGDIPGFVRVKERLRAVVDSLNSATLFNILVYSSDLDVMSTSMVLANAENKKRAAQFIDPYWKAEGGRFTPDAKRTAYLKNYQPVYGSMQPKGGSSRMDMALLAAFEQGADAIFMITDGTPSFTRELNPKERLVYEKRLAQYEYNKANISAEELSAYQQARASVIEENRLVREAEAKAREALGLDKAVSEGGSSSSRSVKAPWGAKPRNSVSVRGNQEFVDWTLGRAQDHYSGRSQTLPTLNIIGYSIQAEGTAWKFLNSLKKEFPGSQLDVFGKYSS